MRARRGGYSGSIWWLIGAGACFGSGVWATHFVSMLAFIAPVPVGYDIWCTGSSIVFSVIGAALAFIVADGKHWTRAPAAGLVLGGAIAAMHYAGMAGMVMSAIVFHDFGTVVAAIALGCVLATCALAVGQRSSPRHQTLAATLLVLSIISLHFTAMAGTTIVPQMPHDNSVTATSGTDLAIAVIAVTGIILLLGSGATVLDRRADREADRFRALAASTFEGILIHRAGIILDGNDAFCAMVRTGPGDIKGKSLCEFLGQENALLTHSRVVPPLDTRLETTLVGSDGRRCPVEILCRPIERPDGPAQVLAIRDLTERRRAEEQVRHLAHHDSLTGLPNRILLNARLERSLADCAQSGANVSLLCIDLDRFKVVNDLLGHRSGDLLLSEVAQRLRGCVRGHDIVARQGGDEFAALLMSPGDEASANGIASRMVDALSRPFVVDGQRVTIGASVGMAIAPRDGTVPELLAQRADMALYAAKEAGRGRVRVFQDAMGQRVIKRRQLEQDLCDAVSRGELELFYQPVVNVSSGLATGYEALIRWNHPERGRVSPADFIPLAEETGLIIPIGQWVLETACAEAATWPGSLSVAVNLSPVQFQQSNIVETLLGVLDRTGLAPERLELEVTEGVLIADADASIRMFHELKAAGIKIALDDFGAGYSSMTYLRRFPFDKIKIDKTFVCGLGADQEAQAIVEAILALAHGLRMDVTAEGVENEQQAFELRKRGCGQVQGFFFGVPVPAAELDFVPLGRSSRFEPTVSRSRRQNTSKAAHVFSEAPDQGAIA
jgi:diguanylate cyclase (GGDEF)-like protein/PAS domain S-box-containing protein